MKIAKYFPVLAGFLILVGIAFRFYHITSSDFIFYDEGFYLNWNRPLGEILAHNHLNGFGDYSKAVYAYVSRSLASGKTLWFMFADVRYFWGGLQDWYFSRVLAAILGVLTLALTFSFTKRFFNNTRLAWFATALLAVLPSHVFYSHIGMQESLSTVLVLAGFYFYLFPKTFGWRTFVAGLFWGLAYFSNYRLIMLPLLITSAEIFLAISSQRWPDFRKWLWAVLAFLSFVFIVGSFNGGENIVVIFSWVFHQANMASQQFDWFNVFSYPYYLFRLETSLFAIFFFANFYLLLKKDRRALMPFALVLVQMAIFTCASEKGARYVGIVLPFMAMSVAFCILEFWTRIVKPRLRLSLMIVTIVMIAMMTYKSFLLIKGRSDYRSSAEFLYSIDPQVKFLSSQNYVQNLYEKKHGDVRDVPPGFEVLLSNFKSGYRYLILCPQAYISMTESTQRFDPHLQGYLGFLIDRFQPKRTYPHFSSAILERFVLEHNENLSRSIKFLNNADREHYGVLRIYDLSEIITPMLKAVVISEGKGR